MEDKDEAYEGREGASDENSCEEGSGSGSSEEESGSETDSEGEEEPVLKYRRFARDVVSSIHDGGGDKNIICCIAVHPKVGRTIQVLVVGII